MQRWFTVRLVLCSTWPTSKQKCKSSLQAGKTSPRKRFAGRTQIKIKKVLLTYFQLHRLKDQLLEREAELRLSKDEATKVQEMFTERSHQVEDTMKRLAVSDNKVLELRAKVSGLETQVEMLRATSQTSCRDQAQLLAACESDKVAASRALQQNRGLKERLEELHQAVMTLTNSKAEVLDQLEDARNNLRAQAGSQGEIQAMREAVKEREALIGNLRNQIRYLEGELARRRSP